MSVNPGTYDFVIQRRSDFSMNLQFKDSQGVGINLGGYSICAQAWDEERLELYATFDIVFTSTTTGLVEMKLAREYTATLPDTAFYDVQLQDGHGNREYYLQGKITVSQGYSEPE